MTYGMLSTMRLLRAASIISGIIPLMPSEPRMIRPRRRRRTRSGCPKARNLGRPNKQYWLKGIRP